MGIHRLAVVFLCVVLSGCFTVIGGATGGMVSSSNNAKRREAARATGTPANESSVFRGVLVGAMIGLVIDAVVISRMVDFNRYEPNQ